MLHTHIHLLQEPIYPLSFAVTSQLKEPVAGIGIKWIGVKTALGQCAAILKGSGNALKHNLSFLFPELFVKVLSSFYAGSPFIYIF